MQTRILPMIGKAARALVDQHRAEGHALAIVTATNSFVTGPIARGDTDTVARQRAALLQHVPELLPLFDAMAAHTRHMLASPIES